MYNSVGSIETLGFEIDVMYVFGIPEEVLEKNPYPGYFKDKQMEKLVSYIKLGQTADAATLGLASKFELECLNEYLLTCWGLVMLQVCRNTPWTSVNSSVNIPYTSIQLRTLLRDIP